MFIKKLKKVVPEQIEATPLQQPFSGKTHNLAHLLAMSRPIAVDRAMFAGRLGLEGTLQAPLAGVEEEVPACRAEGKAFEADVPQLRRQRRPINSGAGMVRPTPDTGEKGEQPQVLALAFVQRRCVSGHHTTIVAEA